MNKANQNVRQLEMEVAMLKYEIDQEEKYKKVTSYMLTLQGAVIALQKAVVAKRE